MELITAGFYLVALGLCFLSLLLIKSKIITEMRLWGSCDPERWEVAGGKKYKTDYAVFSACAGTISLCRMLQFGAVGLSGRFKTMARISSSLWLWVFTAAFSMVAMIGMLRCLEKNCISAINETWCSCCKPRSISKRMLNVIMPMFGLIAAIFVALLTELRLQLALSPWTSQQFSSFQPWANYGIAVLELVWMPIVAFRCLDMNEEMTVDGGWHYDQLRGMTGGLQQLNQVLSFAMMARIVLSLANLWWNGIPQVFDFGVLAYLGFSIKETCLAPFFSYFLGTESLEGWFSSLYIGAFFMEGLLSEVFPACFVAVIGGWQAFSEGNIVMKALVDNAERNLELSLRGEQRATIPWQVLWLPWFRFLRFFNMSDNKLKTLPVRIYRLEFLEVLDVSNNEIESIPLELGWLRRLRSLKLDHNRLHKVPPTCRFLKNLTHLYLSHNLLKTVPESVVYLKCLQYMDISHNEINGLPDKLSTLGRLEELDLSFNKIEEIPSQFFEFTNLKKLNLSNNQIWEIPISLLRDGSVLEFNAEGNPLPVSSIPGYSDFKARSQEYRKEKLRSTAVGAVHPSDMDQND